MIFVNRDAELSFLSRAWQEEGSQLVVIYGKRRIGKTALVKEFSNRKQSGHPVPVSKGLG
jgi:hypothetical protein